ncbi:glycoside hydrolase family 2 protein (plasmid) [Rhizobium gallicum]|uniref:beta-mannosidase n=1 Tax=Rhizobium gallicum TaxID=56730 RepID=A0A1L5NR16_9HYPH|nr:glycoside hydrolase family 2 protein [Rhizobium gallicum]APO70337.1 glycoside hydrolase family 2 protein [Rhizobium gallicum]
MQGRLADISGDALQSDGWNLVLTDAGACASPSDLSPSAGLIPAPVPGTVAEALEKAGLFDREHPHPLNDRDAWYLCRLVDVNAGDAVLRLEGLATLCEVFLNGQKILVSESMFETHDLAVHLHGGDELALCFRALQARLGKPGPRARWRPQMITPQGLRLVRTTLLGHMPGWCPEIQAVGPWRPVSLLHPHEPIVRDLSLRPDLLEDGEGRLHASLSIEGYVSEVTLRCGDIEQAFKRDSHGRCTAILKMPGVTPWWPRTHGIPHLYEVTLIIDDVEHPLGRTGFRRLAIDRGADGRDFGLMVNGERIFCRGAVWTTADIVRLPGGRDDYEPWLRLAAEADMNMVRIGGTMAYETPDFFRLCDEFGLLVWQDFMFANFDYPKGDKDLNAHVEAEVAQFLSATRLSPSLAVVCGGSEIHQQAAMLGLPERVWASPIVEEIIPAVARSLRPDVPYVVNSPFGGAMPFSPNEGVTHYYGVGAYMRPLDDSRRADVRFAAESFAFAHVPQARTLSRHLSVPPVQSPLWKERVPRDRGASWDFEDVRDHYLRELYGFESDRLRREDPDLYLALSQAVTGEVAEECYAEWRRQGSGCNGALVWTLQDLLPGPGWGVIDSTGEPKPTWYALRRAFRPVQVLFTDEGTNGLDVHVINESNVTLDLDLEVRCLRDGWQKVVSGKLGLPIEARAKRKIACTDLFGAFFDTTYAFRFGPPSHDVTVARLTAPETEALIAEAFYFPWGRTKAFHEAEITASVAQQDDHWFLDLRSDRLAQSVQVDLEAYRAEDDWFHLPPGAMRRLRLHPRAGTSAETVPTGQIRALGSRRVVEV